jgi:hypothetical protein
MIGLVIDFRIASDQTLRRGSEQSQAASWRDNPLFVRWTFAGAESVRPVYRVSLIAAFAVKIRKPAFGDSRHGRADCLATTPCARNRLGHFVALSAKGAR